MEVLLSLVKEIGLAAALLAFSIVSIFRLLMAMQTSRSETAGAEAARIKADAQVSTSAATLALNEQQRVASLTDQLTESLSAFADLRVKVTELTARVDTLDSENKSKDAEIARLQKRVNELDAELIQVRDKLESEKRANDLLQSMVEDYKAKHDNLLIQMSSLETQLRLLSTRLEQLSTRELQSLAEEIDAIDTVNEQGEPHAQITV